jgi:hypothetical protein
VGQLGPGVVKLDPDIAGVRINRLKLDPVCDYSNTSLSDTEQAHAVTTAIYPEAYRYNDRKRTSPTEAAQTWRQARLLRVRRRQRHLPTDACRRPAETQSRLAVDAGQAAWRQHLASQQRRQQLTPHALRTSHSGVGANTTLLGTEPMAFVKHFRCCLFR